MEFHHRKLLIFGKINTYNTTVEENNQYDYCGECKDESDNYWLPSPLPPPPSQTHHSSIILILMLCVLGFAFVLVSYFSVVRYRSKSLRRSNSQSVNGGHEDFTDENHGQIVDHPLWFIRSIGLQKSVIDSIAVFKYRKDDGLIEGSDCSVCLSEFQEGENLRLLPKCSHAFHIHCIDTWLRSHQNCPLCRAPVVSNSSQVNVGESNANSLESMEENLSDGVETRVEMESHVEEGENTTGEMRARGGSIDSLPIEEIYDDQSLKKKKVRVKSDLAEYGVKLDEEMEIVRRSISLDMKSASMVYLNLVLADKLSVKGEGSSRSNDEGCSNIPMEQKMKQSSEIISKPVNRNSSIYGLIKSSSLGRSLRKMPISMKRSFSSAGKISLPIHSRSRRDSN